MTGYVYFIKPVGADGPIKIGHSVAPPIRMAQIEVWSPLLLEIIGAIKADVRAEGGLHALLRDHHSHGEWFRADPAVTATIDAILNGAFDLSTLPDPVDLRAKAGFRDGGKGKLASVLTRAINRLSERGADVPPEVLEATERFSGPIYERRQQGRNVADARIVVTFLRRVGKGSDAIDALLTKVEAA